jgi:hypothetical protein
MLRVNMVQASMVLWAALGALVAAEPETSGSSGDAAKTPHILFVVAGASLPLLRGLSQTVVPFAAQVDRVLRARLQLWLRLQLAPHHVLLVWTDDFGFNDIALRDGETTNEGVPLTPTLNKLAEEGILLDNYYVQPSCSPSRACFMSGRYPLHTGINNWLPNEAVGLPLDEVTLADLLKEHGYSTHAIGYGHIVLPPLQSPPWRCSPRTQP